MKTSKIKDLIAKILKRIFCHQKIKLAKNKGGVALTNNIVTHFSIIQYTRS